MNKWNLEGLKYENAPAGASMLLYMPIEDPWPLPVIEY